MVRGTRSKNSSSCCEMSSSSPAVKLLFAAARRRVKQQRLPIGGAKTQGLHPLHWGSSAARFREQSMSLLLARNPGEPALHPVAGRPRVHVEA